MTFSDQFFRALGIDPAKRRDVAAFAVRSGVPPERLRHYNDANQLPTGDDLARILTAAGITELELMLAIGHLSREVLNAIQANSGAVARLLEAPQPSPTDQRIAAGVPCITLETALGRLYQGDCVELMRGLGSGSVDMVFADPPFNLNKLYPSSINDNLRTERYLEWWVRKKRTIFPRPWGW